MISLLSTLREVEAYMALRADVSDGVGNEAMKLLIEVQEQIARLEKKRSRSCCMSHVPGGQSLCTLETGHKGEHRCLAVDVDASR